MRYAASRAQGLIVGSGAVEAGCNTVVEARLQQSGMRWTVAGANAVIALRCCFAARKIARAASSGAMSSFKRVSGHPGRRFAD